jgi:hypothetical protein
MDRKTLIVLIIVVSAVLVATATQDANSILAILIHLLKTLINY